MESPASAVLSRRPAAGPWDKISDIAEQYVEDYARLEPLDAMEARTKGYDDRPTDLSVDGFAALADLDRQTLAALAPRRRTRRGSGSPRRCDGYSSGYT